MSWKITISILTIIFVFSLLFGFIIYPNTIEGLVLVPLATDPRTSTVINGYYQVNDTLMAQVPYGYKVNPINPRKLTPIINTEEDKLNPNIKFSIPKPGEKMPDGYYFLTDSSLAILPPDMLPNLRNIDFDQNSKTLYYYDNGYVSATQYYENKFTPNNYPIFLPEGVYYTDKDKKTMSILRYNMLADTNKGYGAFVNPNINLSMTDFNYMNSNYRDISNNINIQFHDDLNTVKNLYDLSYGEVRVLDQTGNLVILPAAGSQGLMTYYQPGEFPFGASTYVPNYEDSIYLSSIGFRSFLGNVSVKGVTDTANKSSCGSTCQAYNDFKRQMDSRCNL
jgi:hypothetical protein